MKLYNVDEAFELLKEYKITTHKESVRRWLRKGTIKGIRPASKKEGWKISESNLFDFIDKRMPDKLSHNKTTDVVLIEEKVKEKIWWELVSKNIFEDFIEVKKTHVDECFNHLRFSNEFRKYAWKELKNHKRGYSTPRIPYILDGSLYNGQRIKMNKSYERIEDQIIFSVIEHIRQERVKKIKQ